jgi:hypothetical protein
MQATVFAAKAFLQRRDKVAKFDITEAFEKFADLLVVSLINAFGEELRHGVWGQLA